jgi:hypothetical protein
MKLQFRNYARPGPGHPSPPRARQATPFGVEAQTGAPLGRKCADERAVGCVWRGHFGPLLEGPPGRFPVAGRVHYVELYTTCYLRIACAYGGPFSGHS